MGAFEGARRWLAWLAFALSLPAALVCAAAAATIAWSIVTDPGYRSLFVAYGTRMLVLEGTCLAGLVGVALVATGRPAAASRASRAALRGIALAGAVAAILLEAQLWPDADVPLLRGMFVLPYLAWLAYWVRFGRVGVAPTSS